MAEPDSPPPDAPAVEIDLAALCANYRLVARRTAPAEAAAVVKCNAYGLGAAQIARALAEREGCRTFFVASAQEGASLRGALGAESAAAIYVFNGPSAATVDMHRAHSLTPVLNSAEQARLWASAAPGAPAALHIDTGMNRLGAPRAELGAIAAIGGLNIALAVSHLACASEPDHPMNAAQRRVFDAAAALFPGARRSLSASGGAFLPSAYHYDLTRIGVAMYGASPFDSPMAELRTVARLTAPVLQIRTAQNGESVGYGATYRAPSARRIAVVQLGYGDGFPRAGGGRASAFLGGAPCPFFGRVSMDYIALDMTDAPEPVAVGDHAEFFGSRLAIEHAAASCGTLAYELLTGLGARIHRRYLQAEGNGGEPVR